MTKLVTLVLALSGPLLLWGVTVAAARRSLFTLRFTLRILRVWHLVAVFIGAVLLLGFYERPPALYGWGALIFSFGLILPEQWLKRQMQPPPVSPVARN